MSPWPEEPDARDRAEAGAVFGRAVVDEALADLDQAARLYVENLGAVRAAIKGIRDRRQDVAEAQAFAAGLSHEVRVAVAGAWIGDAYERALGLLGIQEVDDGRDADA